MDTRIDPPGTEPPGEERERRRPDLVVDGREGHGAAVALARARRCPVYIAVRRVEPEDPAAPHVTWTAFYALEPEDCAGYLLAGSLEDASVDYVVSGDSDDRRLLLDPRGLLPVAEKQRVTAPVRIGTWLAHIADDRARLADAMSKSGTWRRQRLVRQLGDAYAHLGMAVREMRGES